MSPGRKHPRHPHRAPPPSAVAAVIDRKAIEELLVPWVADRHDRAFLTRCLVEEGPAHHRGANYALLLLLDRIWRRVGGKPAGGAHVPFRMRLPPHLADEREEEAYPLALPTRALEQLAPAGSRDLEALLDCLTDGPPQHAVANVLMINLLQAILVGLEAADG